MGYHKQQLGYALGSPDIFAEHFPFGVFSCFPFSSTKKEDTK